MDAGQDAGQDAGMDAGQDAGMDAGQDAGQDSGPEDSGAEDAGGDAGVGGPVGNPDVGLVTCEAGEPACGTTAGDVCCQGDFAQACQPEPCTGGGNPSECDGPEDCGAMQVCCIALLGGGQSQNTCEMTCDAPDTLCHTDDDCPSGTLCLPGHPTNFTQGTDTYSWWGFCSGVE